MLGNVDIDAVEGVMGPISAQYFLQIRDNYVRQGRRNLDGYRLWNDVHGEKNRTSDLFDAATVLDPKRTDVPDL